MNKNIEPGKTLYNPRDGMEYLKVALTAESKGTRQTAWLIVKQVLALAPDIHVSARNLLASGFSFRLRLVVASGRRGGAGR